MEAWLSGLNPASLTPAALLSLTIVLILRGLLVPKTTHDTVIQAKDQQIQFYKDAYENERTARASSEAQTGELLSLARATNALLAALPRVGGESHVQS